MSLVDITKPLLPTALSSSTVDKLGQHQKNFRKARIQTHDSWVGSANATSVRCRRPPPPKLQWSFPGSAIRVKKTVSSFSVQLFLHRKTSQKVFFYFLMNFSTFIFFRSDILQLLWQKKLSSPRGFTWSCSETGLNLKGLDAIGAPLSYSD